MLCVRFLTGDRCIFGLLGAKGVGCRKEGETVQCQQNDKHH